MPVNVFLNQTIPRKRIYRYVHFSQDLGLQNVIKLPDKGSPLLAVYSI